MVPGDPCSELEDGQMSDYKLLIDGRLVSGAMALNVVNPATEEVVAVAPRADRAQLEQAVAAAKAAFPRCCPSPSPVRHHKLLADFDKRYPARRRSLQLLPQDRWRAPAESWDFISKVPLLAPRAPGFIA